MKSFKNCNTEKCKSIIIRPGSSVKKRQTSMSILGVLLTVLLPSCANVDRQPFTEFNNAAYEITTIDNAVDSHILSVKQREMAEISMDLLTINNLALDFDVDDLYKYEYKFVRAAKEPLFIKLHRLNSGLTDLNALFIEYTSLLAALADDELIAPEDFDQLSSELNNNLRSGLKSLGQGADASRLALFSTVANSAAHAYISNKRKGYLIDIIEGNQKTVDALIAHAQEAIENIRNGVLDEYDRSRRTLMEQFEAGGNKETIAYKFLMNSEITAATFDMLKAMNDTYASLAKTHKKIGTSLKNDQLPSVNELKGLIKNVQKRIKVLKKINEKADRKEEIAAKRASS